uniref:Uncharacterized protein n=1 Tax=Anguilla anguilla TaxID=7936 RepID=A0A0E9TSQ7_ANGAN
MSLYAVSTDRASIMSLDATGDVHVGFCMEPVVQAVGTHTLQCCQLYSECIRCD